MGLKAKEAAAIIVALEQSGYSNLSKLFLDYYNSQESYFATAQWHKDDVEQAFKDNGFSPTEQNIDEVLDLIDEDELRGDMIETGWDYINRKVTEYIDNQQEG